MLEKEAIKNLFRKICWSLNPEAYKKIAAQKPVESIAYFFTIILIAVVIMAFAAVPLLIALPSALTSEFNKFTKFDIDINTSINGSVTLIPTHPLVVIDKNSKMDENQTLLDFKDNSASYMITKDTIYSRGLFGKVEKSNLSEFKDLTAKKDEVKTLFTFLAVLALPGLLILIYIFFALKYLAMVVVLGVLTFIIIRLAKHGMPARALFNIIIHAMTVMILLEIILLPFSVRHYLYPFNVGYGITIGLVPLGIFLFYLIVGLVQNKAPMYGSRIIE